MQINGQVNEVTCPRAMIKGQDRITGALLGTRMATMGGCVWEEMEEKLDI